MPMDLVAEHSGDRAAHKGKKKKNKKGTTLGLNDFLVKSGAVNQASAPAGGGGYDDYGGSSRYPGGGGRGAPTALPVGPRASLGLELDLSQLPPSPPYTAFIGNLPYELEEEDIIAFFEVHGAVCSSCRIPRDTDSGRIKGFGYAEFMTIPDLKKGIEASGEELLTRRVRIDLAGNRGGDDRDGDRGGFNAFSRADDSDDWRRPGASDLPMGNGRDDRSGDMERRGPPSRADDAGEWRRGPADGQPEFRGRGGMGYDDRGYGERRGPPPSRADDADMWRRGPDEAPAFRDEPRDRGMGSGSRPEGADRWQRPSDDQFRRDERRGPPPSRADDAGEWRRSDPVPENVRPPVRRDPPRSDDAGEWRRSDPVPENVRSPVRRDPPRSDADSGEWRRGEAPPPREERQRGDQWRRGDDGVEQAGSSVGGPGRRSEAQQEWKRGEALPDRTSNRAEQPESSRPRLKLAPRSSDTPSDDASDAAGRALFGGAKPIDTSAKDQAVEAKIGDRKFTKKTRSEIAADAEAKAKSKAAKAAAKQDSEQNDEDTPSSSATVASPKREASEDAPSNKFAGLEIEDDEDDQ